MIYFSLFARSGPGWGLVRDRAGSRRFAAARPGA